MKNTLLTLLIFLSLFLQLNAQIDLIIGFGNSGRSDQIIQRQSTSIITNRLQPHDETKASLDEVLNTYNYNTLSDRGTFLELGLGNSLIISKNLNFKLAAVIAYSNLKLYNTRTTFQSKILNSQIIDYIWEPTTTISGSTCDQFIVTDNYNQIIDSSHPINIYSLNLFAGLEYYFKFLDFSFGTEFYLRTPLSSSESVIKTDFTRAEMEDETICTLDAHTERNSYVDGLSNLQIGIAPYLSYKITDRLTVKGGLRYNFNDTFHNSTQSTASFNLDYIRSHKAIESNFQLSYTLKPKVLKNIKVDK